MMNESLWRLRTMREIKKPREVLSHSCLKTTNGLSGSEESIPYTVDEHLLNSLKEQDRQWFDRQESAVAKARKKLLHMRSNLKSIKELNKKRSGHRNMLMAKRQQKESGNDESPAAGTPPQSAAASMFIEY